MRVLLIEDDSATAQSIELMLKSESFNVYTTDLGEEGVDLGKLYDYDIILLDLNLPDMSGYEVLRTLRVAKVQTPILILSGLAGIEDKVRGLGFGADDYMTKPFHKDELVARIHAIVRRSKGHAQSVITTGDLTVNLDTKTVEVTGQRVHLTGKEYQMLDRLGPRLCPARARRERSLRRERRLAALERRTSPAIIPVSAVSCGDRQGPSRVSCPRGPAHLCRCGCSPAAPDRPRFLARGSVRLWLDEHRFEQIAVERLHHEVVGARLLRQRQVADVAFGKAVDDARRVAADVRAQQLQELDAAHDRHLPVEQDHVRHFLPALVEGLLAILGFVHDEVDVLEDAPRDFPHHARIIDDQARFHLVPVRPRRSAARRPTP
jgi:two-component system cell cycle response regulator CtrA